MKTEFEKIQFEIEHTKDKLLDIVKLFFNDSDNEMSISSIQREFKVGYFRAGRIIRQIERGL